MAVSNDWPPPEFGNQLAPGTAGSPRRFECQAAGYPADYVAAITPTAAAVAYRAVHGLASGVSVTVVPAT